MQQRLHQQHIAGLVVSFNDHQLFEADVTCVGGPAACLLVGFNDHQLFEADVTVWDGGYAR